jgi:hypothetical protein
MEGKETLSKKNAEEAEKARVEEKIRQEEAGAAE